MLIGRFFVDGDVKWGVFEKSKVRIISKNFLYGVFEYMSETYDIDDVRVLPPVKPSKIVGIGLNYIEHINELGMEKPKNPMLFLKPSTTVIAHNDIIVYPKHMSKRVDYEGELGVVIGKKTKNISEKDAQKAIYGYTIINDVTARDLQFQDGQWVRAKSFDTFSPIGPFVATDINPLNLKIQTKLNGEIKQNSNTSDMLFNVYMLVSFVSKIMTLLPGDIIATGTPKGVGEMKIGDDVEIYIEKIGILKNRVGGEDD